MGLEVHREEVIRDVEAWKPDAAAGLSDKDYNSRQTPQSRVVVTGNQPYSSRASPAPRLGGLFPPMAELPVQSLRVRLWGSGRRRGGAEGFRTSSAAGWVWAFRAPCIGAAVAGLGAGSRKRRRGWKMPVHSRGDKKETNHHDEMEVDYAENEGSSSEDEDTESSSVSEDGDSSGAQPRRLGPWVPALGSRQAAFRTLGSCVLLGERGGEREGAETGFQPSAAPGRSRALPGSRRVPVGGAGQDAGLGLPSSGKLRSPACGRTRPWDLRAVPGAIHRSGEFPAACLRRPSHTTNLFSYFSPLQPLLLNMGGSCGPSLDLYQILAGLEFINPSFQVSLSISSSHQSLLLGVWLGSCPIYNISEVFKIEKSSTSGVMFDSSSANKLAWLLAALKFPKSSSLKSFLTLVCFKWWVVFCFVLFFLRGPWGWGRRLTSQINFANF